MKKNLIPLLGIAFVVALLATGVFYGLFVNRVGGASSGGRAATVLVAARNLNPGAVAHKEDFRTISWTGGEPPKGVLTSADAAVGETIVEAMVEGEPVLASKIASKSPAAGNGVPSGMRAISVHVSDSAGILSILRPGSKVDVQAFTDRRNGGEGQLRTALQNLTVWAVSGQTDASSQGTFTAAVVTLLATPQQADVLAAADSYARIRLLLRNPLDQDISGGAAYSLSSVFRAAPRAVEPRPTMVARTDRSSGASRPAPTLLDVQLLGVTRKALARLGPAQGGGFRPICAGKDMAQAVRDLESGDGVKLFSRSEIAAAYGRPGTVESMATSEGDSRAGLRLRFSPVAGKGQTRLRIRADVTTPSPDGPKARRSETEVDLGGGVVLAGLLDAVEREALLQKLWKQPTGADRELCVMITPRSPRDN